MFFELSFVYGDVGAPVLHAFVGGADYFAAANEFFHTVRRPARYARNCEKRGIERVGYVEHRVHEALIKVYVGS